LATNAAPDRLEEAAAVARAQGDAEQARAHYAESLSLYEMLGDRRASPSVASAWKTRAVRSTGSQKRTYARAGIDPRSDQVSSANVSGSEACAVGLRRFLRRQHLTPPATRVRSFDEALEQAGAWRRASIAASARCDEKIRRSVSRWQNLRSDFFSRPARP